MADAAVADRTRVALSRAAHDLLAADGPTALTVRRIAAAAGVSTMNVYSRFGGKDGVLDELYTDGFTRLIDTVAAAPITDDPVADLQGCARAYLTFAREAPTFYSLMFDTAVPDYRPGPAARAVAEGAFGQLVEAVGRAMASGQFGTDDRVTVAAGLWAHVHGLASLTAGAIAAGGPAALAGRGWDEIADVAVAAHVRGLAASADDRR